jgi:hypothetical protein
MQGLGELLSFASGFGFCFAMWFLAVKRWNQSFKGFGGDRGYPEFKHFWKIKK